MNSAKKERLGEYDRFGFTFKNERAAHFFDVLLENHLSSGEDMKDFDILAAVIYAAHKFHSLAYRDSFATCIGGYVAGEKALAASKEITEARSVFFDVSPEFRRSYMMCEYMSVLYPAIEKKYNVVFVRTEC
jgi:hypothetical protein